MDSSTALISYHRAPSPRTLTILPSSRAVLIPSSFFTEQIGTSIATELLYRLLFDLLQRFLTSFQRLASRSMDNLTSWIEQKLSEQRAHLAKAKDKAADGGLKIVQEVGKAAQKSGFLSDTVAAMSGACPVTGEPIGGVMGPPPWMMSVLKGIEEGRLVERDFWIQTHGD